jgi:hypothetical protein
MSFIERLKATAALQKCAAPTEEAQVQKLVSGAKEVELKKAADQRLRAR